VSNPSQKRAEDGGADLQAYRRFYAEEVAAVAGVHDEALVQAFAHVPRERFLGPGPWKVAGVRISGTGIGVGYTLSPDADPRRILHNILVGIDPERLLNNGQPSALAAWIDALALSAGESVLHVGAGVGYYTAIIGHMLGPSGHVTGVEIDEELAARAADAVAGMPDLGNVEIVAADGSTYDPGPVDAILVNAGVTHPQPVWLDRLRDGGRLILPLTYAPPGQPNGTGVMVGVTRQTGGYAARILGPVAIYPCEGARRDASNALVAGVMAKLATAGTVRSLRRDAHEATDRCWLHDVDCCLSTEEPA
jgi:protein-L-isoaspartate(D-aspartate) O-methyltransferase